MHDVKSNQSPGQKGVDDLVFARGVDAILQNINLQYPYLHGGLQLIVTYRA